jgi:hypothetical protein
MLAFGLFVGARKDMRGRVLGGLLLLMASAFVQSYLIKGRTDILGGWAAVASFLAPEAFVATALWAFAWVFPAVPTSRRARTIGIWGLTLAAALGVFLMVGNAIAAIAWFPPGGSAHALFQLFDREAPALVFWPATFLVAVTACPYLLFKGFSGTVQDRERVAFLALALVGGLTPLIVGVLLSPFVPALAEPDGRTYISTGVFLGVATLIPSTIYAVLVQRAINVHLVLRGAVQHMVARQLVWGVVVGSLLYVARSLYAGRELPLATLLSQQVGLVSLSAVGLTALTFREHLLRAVDRWFARSGADYSEVMTRLAAAMGRQHNLRDLQEVLRCELINSMQATTVAIVVVNDERTALVSLTDDVLPLSTSSRIIEIFQHVRTAVCLRGEEAHAVVHTLPSAERAWLEAAGVEWCFPLFDASQRLLGLLGLGPARGPAYSKRDRTVIAAMADQMALRMENLSLRQWPGCDDGGRGGRAMSPVDWENERALQCSGCRRVTPAASGTTCECGAQRQPAAVPAILNGKFRIDRVLGTGGMSVVYLAYDMALERWEAIKAMPSATPSRVARLQHEAKAMASASGLHPNLAMIYGAERWRDVPLLVVEYLEGGTLLDSLRAGPLAPDDALSLGIVLADALDRLHSGGILHRDIKPSNIGFTADGIPKLLDFGLAAVLERHGEFAEMTVERMEHLDRYTRQVWAPADTRPMTEHLVGTPLYLSPEALAGNEPDPSFDLWSLSMVLYEAIGGRHPFHGYPVTEVLRRVRSVRVPDVRDFRPDCPAPIAAFLNDALSLSKERRPATSADLRTSLQSLQRALYRPLPVDSRRALY